MSYHEFDTNEVRALVQGKFRFCMCLNCAGKGRELVDGIQGIVVASVPKDADPTDYYEDTCEDCGGLGGTIHFTG